MRDQRWPFWAFIILRPIQLVFAVIILGMTAYMTAELAGYVDIWFVSVLSHMFDKSKQALIRLLCRYAALGLVTSLIAIIYLITSFVLYFSNRLLPLAVVILDAFCVLFYLVAMAGKGDAGFPEASCTYSYGYYYSYSSTNVFCVVGKAAFAFELLSM